MSYTNGILNHDDSQGLGKIGLRGLPGIGFKLDANNDYDMQNKKLVNVKQGTIIMMMWLLNNILILK